MIRRLPTLTLALLAPLALVAGCGSGRSATIATSTTTTSTTVTSTTTATTVTTSPATTLATTATTHATTATTVAPVPGTIQLTDKDNGTTVTVRKGTTIVVVLNSTYWTFPGATAGVLQQQGDAKVSPAPVGTCVPGGGCGTASVTYKAGGAGRTPITASRSSCGEAMACVGNAGSYAVQVVVTG